MTHILEWEKLLSSTRVDRVNTANSPTSDQQEDDRTAFEQDYDRIVFSQPFRRLARKTQVHPMASNDHIHNRLTHSIEVASVGRSFAQRLGTLHQLKQVLTEPQKNSLVWILQSACLIHDIGNPPFGHAGEEVIRAWVEKHEQEIFVGTGLGSTDQLAKCKTDWLHFEGNAQGFRFSSRADNPKAGYLRLTYATLGAAIKYPWSSSDPRAEEKKKHNYYSSEDQIFSAMAEELGLVKSNQQYCRHPLSFLTEAADDICYRIIDLEDAVEMGICDRQVVHDLFSEIARRDKQNTMPLSQLRGRAIKSLMDQCWEVFEREFDSIMNGERYDDLKSGLDRECGDLLKSVGEIYGQIFQHRKKVATELGAYHVLGRILTAFIKTIRAFNGISEYSKIPFISKRTVELTWGQEHVQANLDKDYCWWLSQVMDYVSGMTDDYAVRLSQEIGGISYIE